MTVIRVRRTRARVAEALPVRVSRTRPRPKVADINIETLTGGQMIQVYLMASFLYYIEDISPLRDEDYDRLCVRLLKELPKVKHQHKKYVDPNALRAVTGYHMKMSDYPLMVIGAARSWAASLGLKNEW